MGTTSTDIEQPGSTVVASRRSAKRRQAVGLAAVLAAALVVVCFFFPRQILCVESGDAQADALVVLGGGLGERAERAAELFRQGVAPKVIVCGASDCTINLQLLTNAGVPADAIQLESRSKTTRENAEFSVSLLRADGVRRAIIVTSWYHSRRALSCFRHYAPEIKFYSKPSYSNDARSTWSREGVWRDVREEYVKLPGYWLCYGICPF